MNSNDDHQHAAAATRKAATAPHSNELTSSSAASLVLLGKRASPDGKVATEHPGPSKKKQMEPVDTVSDDESSFDDDGVDEDGNKRERRYVRSHYALIILTYSKIFPS